MLPDGQESLNSSVNVHLVALCFLISAQNVNELLRQFEVSTFEAHVLARRPVENKTKVNVDNVPLGVYHDVAVVPVLYLQDVRDYGVRSKTSYEVQLCHLELDALFASKLLGKVSIEVDLKRFAKLVPARGVGHKLYDASHRLIRSSPIAQHRVRRHVQVEVRHLENSLEQLNHLKSQNVLSHVIVNLENTGHYLRFLASPLNCALFLYEILIFCFLHHHLFLIQVHGWLVFWD